MKKTTALAKTGLCLAFLSFMSLPIYASDDELSTEQVAQDYLSAYPFFEPKKLASYLTDGTRWSDPTFEDDSLQGRDEILGMLAEFVEGTSHIDFNHELMFTTGNHAVFRFSVDMTYPGEAVNSKLKEVKIRGIDGVTVLKVVNGKVVEHQDFSNIDKFNAQFKEQTEGKNARE